MKSSSQGLRAHGKEVWDSCLDKDSGQGSNRIQGQPEVCSLSPMWLCGMRIRGRGPGTTLGHAWTLMSTEHSGHTVFSQVKNCSGAHLPQLLELEMVRAPWAVPLPASVSALHSSVRAAAPDTPNPILSLNQADPTGSSLLPFPLPSKSTCPVRHCR